MNTSELSKPQELVGGFVFINIVVLIGVIINLINSFLLYTILKNPVLTQEPRYILYMQLIINDIITLSLSVTLFVLSYLPLRLNVTFCCILILIACNVFRNTPLNLAGMAIERYVAVCYPLHHAQICTTRNTKILILIIWLVGALPGMMDFSVILAFRPLSFFTTSCKCYYENVFTLGYHVISQAVFNIGYMCSVWVLLFYTYFRVLFSAKAAASEPAQAQKARRTILLHGVQLLLCTLSLFTAVLNGSLTSLFPSYIRVIYYCNFILTSILPHLLSPLIYGMRDQKFKKYIKCFLMCNSSNRATDPLDKM